VANNTYMGSSVLFVGTPASPSATPLAILACPSDALPSPPTTWSSTYNTTSGGVYFGVTSYLANLGSGAPAPVAGDGVIVDTNLPVAIPQITDGTANTLLFGERYNNDPNWTAISSSLKPWTGMPFYAVFSPWGYNNGEALGGFGVYPLNYTFPPPPLTNLLARIRAFGSAHSGGANFTFCDGSVRFISNAINSAAALPNGYALLEALCTRAGGETVDASQY
jgi:prepilin-type processing-associated H-X9-DG protein